MAPIRFKRLFNLLALSAVAVFCLGVERVAASPICDEAFSSDAFDAWASEGVGVRLTTENLKRQLFDSFASARRALAPRRGSATGPLTAWTLKEGRPELTLSPRLFESWVSPKGRSIPLQDLWTMHASLEHAASNAGLSEPLAFELGLRIQREVLLDLDESWPAYSKFLRASFGISEDRAQISDNRMEQVTAKINAHLVVDRRFDIPAFAGYSTHSSKFVYLDKSVPANSMLKDGRAVNVGRYVVVHEFIEKELIDLWQLTDHPYYRTHQIAQRVEKNAVQAAGFPWGDYQRRIIAEIAELVDANSKELKDGVPSDLDLTPYTDGPSFEDIDFMKSKMINPR